MPTPYVPAAGNWKPNFLHSAVRKACGIWMRIPAPSARVLFANEFRYLRSVLRRYPVRELFAWRGGAPHFAIGGEPGSSPTRRGTGVAIDRSYQTAVHGDPRRKEILRCVRRIAR